MAQKPENADFGTLAVALGFLSKEDLDRAVAIQIKEEQAGRPFRIGEICLQHKMIDREGVLLILRAQGMRILRCTSCRKTYNVPDYRPDKEFPCKHCGRALALPNKPVTPKVSGDIRKEESKIIPALPVSEIMRHLLPGYELKERVGQGGMGTVFSARDLILKRMVAVKILSPMLAGNEEYVDRFFQEAKNAQKLKHPHIVAAYDAGLAGDHKFFLMEFVDGPNLGQELRRRGKFSEGEALEIIRQIVSALSYAWGRRIIHRDIKPANIMVTKDGEVKICDLGLSKDVTADLSLTMSGLVSCSPAWASPEQSRGERNMDCRTDTYSLGVTLFQMVTGSLPFVGKTPGSLILQHATQEAPDPREHNPQLSESMASLILEMMTKDAAKRPMPEQLEKRVAELLSQTKPLRTGTDQ